MEKQISRYGYWLGLACVVIAVIMRSLAAIGILMPAAGAAGGTAISYNSFCHGAALFLLLWIASNCLSLSKNQK